MDEPTTQYDVAMDLVTMLYLGGDRRVFSDKDGTLEKAIARNLTSLPNSFSNYLSHGVGSRPSWLGDVLAAATELEMITWQGDALDEFVINYDDANALLRAAAINTPFETMCDMGRILCHAVRSESI